MLTYFFLSATDLSSQFLFIVMMSYLQRKKNCNQPQRSVEAEEEEVVIYDIAHALIYVRLGDASHHAEYHAIKCMNICYF